MQEVSIAIALLAGVVSFLSPCVLPLVPGFLAYLAGGATAEHQPSRKEVFLNSLFFVLGFSLVFAALGVLLNTILLSIAYDLQTWLARIGGIIIIFFGLYLIKLIKIPWLERDHKIVVKKKFKSRYVTSLLFGFAFAVGWTPCVGAALGAILALSATAPGSAFSLLFAYSLGLGLPFLLIGLFTGQATRWIARWGKALEYTSIAFGVILIILGVLVFTQSLNLIANFGFVNALIQS
jgi:cytochrome c-type biogenesis protein